MTPSRFFGGLMLLALVLLFAAPSCSSSTCTASEGTLTVKVTDQNIDDPTNFICNATVTITSADGGSPVTLTPEGTDGTDTNCAYTVQIVAGTYTITATAPNYTTENLTEMIDAANCVTSSDTLTMTLAQADQP